MIASIVGAALKVGSSVIGGINAAKARRRIREAIERQKTENENWYNRRYNEDSLQRADTWKSHSTLTPLGK